MHALAMTAAIILTAVAQVLLKTGAARGRSFTTSFLNGYTLTGYAVFGVVTVFGVFALQGIRLSTFTAWASLAYPLVMLLSYFILREYLAKDRLLGTGLIVLGILVFSL